MTARSEISANVVSLSVLAAALALMVLFAAAPFVRLSTIDAAISEHQVELSNLQRQLATEGEVRKENSELAMLGQDTDLLLKGETTGIAGANLQKLLNNLVVAHGGAASSFQILPPQEDGNLVRIPMGLSISVGVDGLRDILYDLETGTPLIFLDEIAIRSRQGDFQAPDPNYIGPYDVTLQLSGFAKKNGTP
ncbi:type II secretion system protein GspM [Hyphomicrobium facile]|uniref:General secretion pathway protein M n=1 Tax=Hyphomicrobium facile TaxID=51670 RepID=A0A1I7N4I7_9HYPH|nr:type II secretion system protein GspM [Hyphomicrobium facile]SFV29579.1 general secretion pathway protein M [Hyphomicrobium facile]